MMHEVRAQRETREAEIHLSHEMSSDEVGWLMWKVRRRLSDELEHSLQSREHSPVVFFTKDDPGGRNIVNVKASCWTITGSEGVHEQLHP